MDDRANGKCKVNHHRLQEWESPSLRNVETLDPGINMNNLVNQHGCSSEAKSKWLARGAQRRRGRGKIND